MAISHLKLKNLNSDLTTKGRFKMEFKNLIYEIKDRIGVLTLNRPKLLNALNHETLFEMNTLLRQIKEL